MKATKRGMKLAILLSLSVTDGWANLEAAQVAKVKRSEHTLFLLLNRSEYKELKGQERIQVYDKRTRRALDGLVKRLRPGQAIVKISRKDKIPASLRSKSSIRVSPIRKPTTMSLAARRRPEANMDVTNRNVVRYRLGGSESNRVSKSVSFDTEIGTAIAPIPTAGATLGFYLSRNTAFELNYARGSEVLESEEIFNGLAEVQPTVVADILSVRIKRFLSNSFYINSGLGLRSLNLVANPTELDDSFEVISSGPVFTKRRVDATFEFSIGNKWQNSYFNIGIDWIGLQAPLSKVRLPNDGLEIALNTDSNQNPGTFLQADGDLESDIERFEQKRGTTFSSRFYIGFSF